LIGGSRAQTAATILKTLTRRATTAQKVHFPARSIHAPTSLVPISTYQR
jgi:hypothetical protein